jgi:hypothetical protein
MIIIEDYFVVSITFLVVVNEKLIFEPHIAYPIQIIKLSTFSKLCWFETGLISPLSQTGVGQASKIKSIITH